MSNFGQPVVQPAKYTAKQVAERQQLYKSLPTPEGEFDIYMISLIAFIGLMAVAMIVRD